jgi:hypothetical protein
MKSSLKQVYALLINAHHAPLQLIVLSANIHIFYKLSHVWKHVMLDSINIIKLVYLIAHFLPTQFNHHISVKIA